MLRYRVRVGVGFIERKSPIFTHPVYLTPPLMGFPLEFCIGAGVSETRVIGLSGGRKSFPIGLAVLIQYQSVTASQPPSHVAVAITLNAKASSLKRTTQKTKKAIEYSIQNETRTRETKLVNLNTTQNQPRNRPLACPGQNEGALQRTTARGPPGHARDT